MRFVVKRTSTHEKPCEEANRLSTPSSFPRWEMEIDTLDNLLQFVRKYGGKIIISATGDPNIDPVIEIYDDWRE